MKIWRYLFNKTRRSYLYVAYSRSNRLGLNFLWTLMGGRGCNRDQKNEKKFQIFYFFFKFFLPRKTGPFSWLLWKTSFSWKKRFNFPIQSLFFCLKYIKWNCALLQQAINEYRRCPRFNFRFLNVQICPARRGKVRS